MACKHLAVETGGRLSECALCGEALIFLGMQWTADPTRPKNPKPIAATARPKDPFTEAFPIRGQRANPAPVGQTEKLNTKMSVDERVNKVLSYMGSAIDKVDERTKEYIRAAIIDEDKRKASKKAKKA